MTMTAISKGFRRIMKLLYDYGNRREDNVKLKTKNKWTNEFEMAKSGQKNDELLGEFNFPEY